MTKTSIALAAALVLGAATTAFAEDSSSSFRQNIYGPYGSAVQTQTFEGRNVALTGRAVALPRSQTFGGTQATGYDRASSPYAGGGF